MLRSSLIAFSTVLLLAPACAPEKPLVTYRAIPPANALEPAIELPENTYLLIRAERSVGRFPMRIAVARLRLPEDHSQTELDVEALSPAEQGRWTELFKSDLGVTDVLYISPVLLRGIDHPSRDLCALTRELGADFLLTYSAERVGPNAGEALGVLYDARGCSPVAAIQHRDEILGDEDHQTPEELADAADVEDSRPFDAAYAAFRAFEESTLAAVRALQARDKPAPTTQPHRWTHDASGRYDAPGARANERLAASTR